MPRSTPSPEPRRIIRIGRYELLYQPDDDPYFPDPKLLLRTHRKRHLRLVRHNDQSS